MTTFAARNAKHTAIRIKCIKLREKGRSASEAAEIIGISRCAVIGHWWRYDNGNGKTLKVNGKAA